MPVGAGPTGGGAGSVPASASVVGLGPVVGRRLARLDVGGLLGALGRARRTAVDRTKRRRDAGLATLHDRTVIAFDGYGPQTGRLQRCAERIGIADEDDRHLLRRDVRSGGGQDGIDRDRLDRRPIAGQLVVGQVMDDETGERSNDRARGLESQRKDPDEEIPGRPKLGVVAREVTLLPRHWDWLARQPGGAFSTASNTAPPHSPPSPRPWPKRQSESNAGAATPIDA